MQKFRPRAMLVASAMSLFSLPLFAPAAQAGDVIKARLVSSSAAEEASGTLTLDGFALAGHLSGEGIDVTISGTVKSSSVSVIVTGRIMPNCSLNRQSMSSEAPNEGAKTSIIFDFTCSTKGGSYGRGDDYLYRLELDLPAHRLEFPIGTDSGESAAREPDSGKTQGNPA
jgi:hypothetical protein